MITHRKKHNSDTWHWCRNCSQWPTTEYTERYSASKPKTGTLCRECLEKNKQGKCIIYYTK